jgi:hypothetical protein
LLSLEERRFKEMMDYSFTASEKQSRNLVLRCNFSYLQSNGVKIRTKKLDAPAVSDNRPTLHCWGFCCCRIHYLFQNDSFFHNNSTVPDIVNDFDKGFCFEYLEQSCYSRNAVRLCGLFRASRKYEWMLWIHQHSPNLTLFDRGEKELITSIAYRCVMTHLMETKTGDCARSCFPTVLKQNRLCWTKMTWDVLDWTWW